MESTLNFGGKLLVFLRRQESFRHGEQHGVLLCDVIAEMIDNEISHLEKVADRRAVDAAVLHVLHSFRKLGECRPELAMLVTHHALVAVDVTIELREEELFFFFIVLPDDGADVADGIGDLPEVFGGEAVLLNRLCRRRHFIQLFQRRLMLAHEDSKRAIMRIGRGDIHCRFGFVLYGCIHQFAIIRRCVWGSRDIHRILCFGHTEKVQTQMSNYQLLCQPLQGVGEGTRMKRGLIVGVLAEFLVFNLIYEKGDAHPFHG